MAIDYTSDKFQVDTLEKEMVILDLVCQMLQEDYIPENQTQTIISLVIIFS